MGGIQNGLTATEILFSQLDQKLAIKEALNAIELMPGKLDVMLENVSFAYSSESGLVLDDISLLCVSGQDLPLCWSERRRKNYDF